MQFFRKRAKKGKKVLKKDKIFQNLDKNVMHKIWILFEKGQVTACDNHMKLTARIGPGISNKYVEISNITTFFAYDHVKVIFISLVTLIFYWYSFDIQFFYMQ